MILNRLLIAACLMVAGPVHADAPRVVTDIAPVHALVAQVMAGVGAPDLLVPPGASPHGFALRPSQARALQDAGLIVWVGPTLTPWIEKPLASLAGSAASLDLLDASQTVRLPFREQDDFGTQQHDHGDHDHAAVDPHAWLDPENARIWLGVIAQHLSTLDPENAARYGANAAAGQTALATLTHQIESQLAPVQGAPFVTFHDAYHYFEDRFGLTSAGTVTLADAVDPSPAQLARLRSVLQNQGIACALTEPGQDAGLLEAAAEGLPLKIVQVDPMGSRLQPGPDLYPRLLSDLADAFSACLTR